MLLVHQRVFSLTLVALFESLAKKCMIKFDDETAFWSSDEKKTDFTIGEIVNEWVAFRNSLFLQEKIFTCTNYGSCTKFSMQLNKCTCAGS